MNTEVIGEFAQRAYDKAKVVAGLAFLATATVGGGAAAGYAGLQMGEAIAPTAETMLSQVAHYAAEGTPMLIGALVGAATGFGVGVWVLDGGLVEAMEGGQ